MRRVLFTLAVGLALSGAAFVGDAFASPAPVPPGLDAAGQPLGEWREANAREAEPEPSEFKLINYFFVRGTMTNQLGDPSGLRGVSLGPIGVAEGTGSSVSTGDDTRTMYVEQRWIPVLAYSPRFVDGLATFRAQIEVDYAWGIAANALQNNQGGGFNADQVNIQTKNVNVALTPFGDPRKLSIIVGTHSVYDSIYDPTVTSLFDIIQTGYKLTFMGTDATGISAFTNTEWGIGKIAAIPMQGAQPKKASDGDARFAYNWLLTTDYAYQPRPGTVVGVSYWRLEDNSEDDAFAYQGLVKAGPASSALPPYAGTRKMSIQDATGVVNYFGAHFHHNINFKTSRFGASGFFMYNLGEFESQKDEPDLNPKIDVKGYAANLELKYNWGYTSGDVITLEGLYASGDEDALDDEFTAPLTMNYYGLPGAVWFNHKTLILFPFTSTISNYTGAVTDISNQGLGLATAIATASYDLVPHTLNLKLGAAFARSQEKPLPIGDDPSGDPGKTIGTELNAELKWHLKYLMTLGLHGGVLLKGDFYDANERVQNNPYAVFTTFTWYGF